MKASEVKSLFNKYVKANLASQNWTVKGHLIIKEINAGLLRGVCFNSSAFGASQFEPVLFVQPLYVPVDFVALTFGVNLKTKAKKQWWDYNEVSASQVGLELADVINRAESDFLSKVKSAAEFYEYYRKDKKVTIRHFEAVAYSSAYAKLPKAEDELQELLSYIKKKEDINIEWVREIYTNTQKLLQSNQFAILNEWESATRKELKV